MQTPEFLYDDMLQTRTRFFSVAGETERMDLAILYSERFFEKALVLNLLSNRFAIVGQDDLEDMSSLCECLGISLTSEEELYDLLVQAI